MAVVMILYYGFQKSYKRFGQTPDQKLEISYSSIGAGSGSVCLWLNSSVAEMLTVTSWLFAFDKHTPGLSATLLVHPINVSQTLVGANQQLRSSMCFHLKSSGLHTSCAVFAFQLLGPI